MNKLSNLATVTRNTLDYVGKDHPVAASNPMMREDALKALKGSIRTEGQIHAVLTYRGLIIDGRNRVKALAELGITDILVKELPHKTPKEELEAIALATEVRRHQTPTQLAIKAMDLVVKGAQQKEAANRIGVSQATVKAAVAINKMSPMIIGLLRTGGKVEVLTLSNKTSSTDSLQSILAHLRREEAKAQAKLEAEGAEFTGDNVSDKVKRLLKYVEIEGLTNEEYNDLLKGVAKLKINNCPDLDDDAMTADEVNNMNSLTSSL